jgi:radial spoke head protein 1
LREGYGVYFYVNGDKYEGEWKEHLRHGQGTYTYNETGSKYVGLWRKGKMTGHGEIIHKNFKYVGKFKDNYPKGNGKYEFDIGAEQIGEYLTTAEPPEEGAEEDAPLIINSRWIASNTQKKSNAFEPTAEDLIEKEEEKDELNNDTNSNGGQLEGGSAEVGGDDEKLMGEDGGEEEGKEEEEED